MRRTTTLLIAALSMSLAVITPTSASTDAGIDKVTDWADIAVENTSHAFPVPDGDTAGRTWLTRSENDLKATSLVRGLEPGGVYTFWWVVVHDFNGDAPVIPDEVFVERGAGVVIGSSGEAVVRLRPVRIGDTGIEGFLPDGVGWHALTDTMGSLVRVEIAYHGQADEAESRTELNTWLSDFWTGSACPGGLPNQPHCPVYMASTHLP